MNINKDNKKKKFIVTLGIALLISILAGIMSLKGFPENIELMAEDGLYQNPGVIPDNIKIIAVDEETLLKLGPYSDWDRSCFADLINALNADPEHAPSVIGIDFVFSGTNYSEEDDKLVQACADHDNVVVASTATFDSRPYEENDKYYNVYYISAEGKPFDSLANVVDYGFTNAIFDTDGRVRKFYTRLQFNIDGNVESYESFSYKIASKVADIKDYPSQLEINYVGNPGEFEIISMSAVLDGDIKPEHFEDCIVLVGAYEEGMMDSYKVPVDYSSQMYGVEMQANAIYALINDRMLYPVNEVWQFIIAFVIVGIFAFYAMNSKLKNALIATVLSLPGYVLVAYMVCHFTAYKLNLLAVPLGIVMSFLVAVLHRYIEIHKRREQEMQDMLFSMAEAMAETIEGRTPYNANHTKNVAKRCVEMLDFINLKHKEKKTELHFTEDDKRQLYLAAMLHDVGKMDIPLEVMDKETKLGGRDKDIKARLEIISLKIELDALSGIISIAEAEERQERIKLFVGSLGAFNCGRPLKEDEWSLVEEIAGSTYIGADGVEIPYLTEEEIDDLHIKAGTLSEKERTIMQSHAIYTDKILSHIQFGEHFDKVRSMASNHHELLNGKGYPKGLGEEELDTMTRILTIMDIYDSLIADDRPYKKPKTVKVAFEILDEEAEAGKVDKELLEFAKELYLREEN